MSMDDREIIELFFGRSEAAVSATEEKYGAYFRYIAGNILGDALDVEECVNDVLATLWRLIPPAAPANFKAYAGRITRNLALKRLEHNSAVKRSGCDLILDELANVLPDSEEDILGTMLLRDTIHKFLSSLPEKKRRIFLRRYWYLCRRDRRTSRHRRYRRRFRHERGKCAHHTHAPATGSAKNARCRGDRSRQMTPLNVSERNIS